MMKKKKGWTWLALVGSIASSLFVLSSLGWTGSAYVTNRASAFVSSQQAERKTKRLVSNSLTSTEQVNSRSDVDFEASSANTVNEATQTEDQIDDKRVETRDHVTNSIADDQDYLPAVQKISGLVIAAFKGHTALVDLGDHQLSEFVDVPEDVNFVCQKAFNNSRACFVKFRKNATVRIAGGAKLPTNIQYSVYDDETAQQLIGAGVTGAINVRKDQTTIKAIGGLVYKYVDNDSPKTLVGLTSSGQEEGELIIPHDINLIAEGALNDSQATLIKFNSTEPICFRGEIPNAEYEVENLQTAINLINAGVKQDIVLKSKKICISEQDIKNFVLTTKNDQIILTGLTPRSQDENSLKIPGYVDQIAAGALDHFKGKQIFFMSPNEVVLHGKVPNVFYYSINQKMVDRLINAGAQKDRTFCVRHLRKSGFFNAAIIVSVLAGLAFMASLGLFSFYFYQRKKSKKTPRVNRTKQK